MPLEEQVRIVAADYLKANEFWSIPSICIYRTYVLSLMHLEQHVFQCPLFFYPLQLTIF